MGVGQRAATSSVTTWHPYSKLTLRTKALWYPGSPKTTNVSPSCENRITCPSASVLLAVGGREYHRAGTFLGLGKWVENHRLVLVNCGPNARQF
jgi:hypothetical protein